MRVFIYSTLWVEIYSLSVKIIKMKDSRNIRVQSSSFGRTDYSRIPCSKSPTKVVACSWLLIRELEGRKKDSEIWTIDFKQLIVHSKDLFGPPRVGPYTYRTLLDKICLCDQVCVVHFPVHSDDYIGNNMKEDGNFTSLMRMA